MPFSRELCDSRPLCTCRNEVMQSVCSELFCSTHSEQIKHFILPSLAHGADPFPFVPLLRALVPPNIADVSSWNVDTDQGDWNLLVEHSLWLLYTILTLGQTQIGKSFSTYLYVISASLMQSCENSDVRAFNNFGDECFVCLVFSQRN